MTLISQNSVSDFKVCYCQCQCGTFGYFEKKIRGTLWILWRSEVEAIGQTGGREASWNLVGLMTSLFKHLLEGKWCSITTNEQVDFKPILGSFPEDRIWWSLLRTKLWWFFLYISEGKPSFWGHTNSLFVYKMYLFCLFNIRIYLFNMS